MDVSAEKPLPFCVRKRLLAVLKLQQESIDTDVEFHRRLFEVEREFNEKRRTIYTKRAAIINGGYEPAAEDYHLDFLAPDAVMSAMKATEEDSDALATIKGIPNFWLEALHNSSMTGAYECDRSALKYLNDIQLEMNMDPNLTFSITFKFDSNPFFENESLTKGYFVDCSVDRSEPFAYDGAQIYKSIGCDIKWKDGMDYTKDQNSFFHFFRQPGTDAEDAVDARTFDDITTDFEVGLFLKEKLIPKAVLYFLSNEFESVDGDAHSSSGSRSASDGELFEDEKLD